MKLFTDFDISCVLTLSRAHFYGRQATYNSAELYWQ